MNIKKLEHKIYKLMASSMVSGNFFRKVSGLKHIEIAVKMAAPLNNSGGRVAYWLPYGEKK